MSTTSDEAGVPSRRGHRWLFGAGGALLVLLAMAGWPLLQASWRAQRLHGAQQELKEAHLQRAALLRTEGRTPLALIAINHAARALTTDPELERTLLAHQIQDLAERPGSVGGARVDEAEYLVRWASDEQVGENWVRAVARANIQAAQGNRRGAMDSLREAIQTQPAHPLPHFLLGDLLRLEDKLDDAEISLRRALELEPQHEGARVVLGSVLLRRKKPEEAEQALRPLMERQPTAITLGLYGIALATNQKLEPAVEPLQQSLRLDPKQPEVGKQLGLVLLQLKKPAEAAAVLEAVQRQAPSEDTRLFLARSLRLAGRLEDAAEHYTHLIKTSPRLPIPQAELGSLLEEQGQRDQALSLYRRALPLAARAEGAEELLQKIQERIAALQGGGTVQGPSQALPFPPTTMGTAPRTSSTPYQVP